jgi:hypothetical protein
MLWRSVAAGALAAVVCWGWAAAAHAGDVLRLGLNSEAPTFNLKGDGGAPDVLPVWGHRGGAASFYRGYYPGYYSSFYYPRYYGSFYSPWYYGSFYSPWYGYSYYYPSYYYGISFASPIGCPAGGKDVPGLVLTPGCNGSL